MVKEMNLCRPYFYRAMLCMAQTMLSQDVRLSVGTPVYPTHAGIMSKRLNIITYPKTFSPLGSHTIIVFPHRTLWQYSP